MPLKNSSVFLLLLLVAGCGTPPAPKAGFVDSSREISRPDLPFERVWVQEGVDWKKYKQINVAPVSTMYVMQTDSWKSVSHYGRGKEDVDKVAEYMQKAIIKAFKDDPNHRFTTVSSPAAGSLILEIALTQLTPNSPALKAAGMIPIYGWAAKAIDQMDPSTVAFEARLRDGATGDIIATFSDCRKQKATVVSVDSLTWCSYAYKIIDDWAGELVEIANKRPGQVVKKAAGFDLKPW